MADKDLTVTATIEGNASGAQPVVDGLNKIKAAGGQAGSELKNLDGAAKASGESLGDGLASKTIRAREMISGLSQVLSGGSSAFYGLGRVVQSVMTAIGGSMAAASGGITLVIGAIITAISMVIKAFQAAGDSAAKNFDIIKSNADEIKNTEQVWDGQIDKLNQMESEYRDAAAASDALRSSQEKLLDAKLNMQLKQLDLEEQRALAGAGGDKLAESAIKSQFSEKRFMATTARDDEKTQAKIAAYNDQLERNSEQMIDVNAQLGRHKQVLALVNPKFEQLAFALGMSTDEALNLFKDKEAYREALKKATEAEKNGESVLQDSSSLSLLGQYGATILGAERGIRTAEKQKGRLTTEYEATNIARSTEEINIQASQAERNVKAFDQGKTTALSMDQLTAEMRRVADALIENKQAQFDAVRSGTVEDLNAARADQVFLEKRQSDLSAQYNSLKGTSQQSASALGQDYVAGTKSPQVAQAVEAVQQATGEAGKEMATSVRGMGQSVTTSMSQVGQDMVQSLGSIQNMIATQNQSIQSLAATVQKTASDTATVKQQVANMR
jgi:hypothetical protein